jgi:hypothetical protein
MEVSCVKIWVRELFIIVTIGMVNKMALISCSRELLLLPDSASYHLTSRHPKLADWWVAINGLWHLFRLCKYSQSFYIN